jgi:hypothetical protein
MFNIFEEISWPQFVQLPNVARLSLNEQVQHYNQYLFELSEARTSWITYQNKGPMSGSSTPTPIESGFLLQEDLFDLLQENGNNIIITTLP